MLINGQVGPQSLGDGTNPPLRLDKTGAQVVTELHGKFFETNYRGNLFLAANAAAGTAISAAAAASTWTLWNPPASGKNLVLVRTSLAVVSGTFVVGGIHYAAQVNVAAPGTLTAAPTVASGIIGGGGVPVAKVYVAVTFAAAPVLYGPVATKNASAPFGQIIDQPDGSIIVAPGSGLSLVSVGADTTPLWSIGMAWEEVPV